MSPWGSPTEVQNRVPPGPFFSGLNYMKAWLARQFDAGGETRGSGSRKKNTNSNEERNHELPLKIRYYIPLP